MNEKMQNYKADTNLINITEYKYYKVEGRIYGSLNAFDFSSFSEDIKEFEYFKGFFITIPEDYEEKDWSYVKTPLYNYHFYKFKFYCALKGNDLPDLWSNQESNIRVLIQENLELIAISKILLEEISLIIWISKTSSESNIPASYYELKVTKRLDSFLWNYYRQNRIQQNKGADIYGIRFRCVWVNDPPPGIYNSFLEHGGHDIFYSLFPKEDKIEEIISKIVEESENTILHFKISEYVRGLFLENNGFLNDAFLCFYKILEHEFENINAENKIISKENFKIEFNNFIENRSNTETINIDDFNREVISLLKKESSKVIWTKVSKKYGLSADIKDLSAIRGKISAHKMKKIDDVHLNKLILCKISAWKIILKDLNIGVFKSL